MNDDFLDVDVSYSDALAFVAHSLDMKESLIENADAVIASPQELSTWMRSHLGPKDGVHEILIRAVESLQIAGYELDTPAGEIPTQETK